MSWGWRGEGKKGDACLCWVVCVKGGCLQDMKDSVSKEKKQQGASQFVEILDFNCCFTKIFSFRALRSQVELL